MPTTTKTSKKTTSKIKYLRIPLDSLLYAKIQSKQKELPLLDEVEIVKIFISKGIVNDNQASKSNAVTSMFEILEKQEKQNRFITGLTEEEQYNLLKENDLI